MTKHRKHRTHLPKRFLLNTPEENLVAAIIRQAWCDAFMRERCGYIGIHLKKEKDAAVKMFEENKTNEYRQSLTNLADLLGINDKDIVRGYFWYKQTREEGSATSSPDSAFDTLLKVLIDRKEQK